MTVWPAYGEEKSELTADGVATASAFERSPASHASIRADVAPSRDGARSGGSDVVGGDVAGVDTAAVGGDAVGLGSGVELESSGVAWWVEVGGRDDRLVEAQPAAASPVSKKMSVVRRAMRTST